MSTHMPGDRCKDRLLESRIAALYDASTGASGRRGRHRQPEKDALAFALRLLAEAYRLPFAQDFLAPQSAEGEAPVQERLKRAARVNYWRMRKVRITEEICRTHSVPLLAFAGKDRVPVAVFPRGGEGVYYDPQSGEQRPLTAAVVSSFDRHGYRLYERLPDHALHWKEAARFAFADSGPVLAFVLAAGCLAGLLGLIHPLVVEYVTGKIIPTANTDELLQLFFFLTALALSEVLLATAPKLALLAFSIKRLERFEAAVFDRLLRVPVTFFRAFTAGDLCTRVLSLARIQESLFSVLIQQIMGSLFSLLSLVMIFYYSWRLAFVGMAATLLYCTLLIIMLRRSLPELAALAEARGRMAGLLKQFFDGIAKIRTSGAEERVVARYLDDFIPATRSAHAVQRNAGRLALLGVLFPALVTMLFYWLVGSTLRSSMEMPQYLAFIVAFGGFQGGVLSLCQGIWRLWEIRPELKRIEPILQCEAERAQGQADPGPLDGAVELAHVSFRYGSEQALVLEDVSLSAGPGEFVAVVGPSGSGKSTLVRMLLGFEKPEAGGVFYSGRDMALLDPTAVRRQLGVILQNSRVMPGTILDNIVSGTEYTIEDAAEAVRMASLDADIAAMPMGMLTMVGAGLLSGGQEQRLLIARALVGNPPLLIMDEATSALDNVTQDTVRVHIEQLRSTRIVIAHRLSTVMHADRIYVLDKGRVVQTGTYDSLVGKEGLFQELVRYQTA